MNQNQIQQLTTHLSQALDQNYDVVNMDAVLSVICALEGTTITKEQLEATRLAKYINQLRRRTKNEHLARRAKSLLKKWREMVGIQPSATENVAHSSQIASQPPHSTSDLFKTNLIASDSRTAEPNPQLPFSQSSLSQQTISDSHLNVDSFEPPPLGVHTQLNKNFLNLANSFYDCEREESNSMATLHNTRDWRQPQPTLNRHVGSPQPIVIEQSLNSVFNLTDVSTEKIREASVVIDIVSDSDENDNNFASKRGKSNLVVPVPIVIPTTPSSRQKKLKKGKKIKDRDVQVAQTARCTKVNDVVLQSAIAADSEVFSLSNSSMSSILSGDATLGNSQHKTRLSSSELTFTGRFKSVNQLDLLNHINTSSLAGQTSVFRPNESGKPKIDEYSTFDSSASCSRLSPSTTEEVGKSDNLFDARLHNTTAIQIPMPTPGIDCDPNSRPEYLENASQSQIPKRRGRKKGSKGVDALIAKESSSLSQQIFFGGSTVKKVKTTKELFNEIQSRKLSVSMQSSTSNLSNSSINREQTSRSIFPRPTSSCSDTSMHSPQNLETYSGNATFTSKIEDPANTDSDTVTSEPSHDSNKSQEIKDCTSLDSNSNSLQTLARNSETLTPKHFNDVTTQLMHLVHSLNSPLSEAEIEKMYRAHIIPCTCKVIEEVQNTLEDFNNSTSDTNMNNPKICLNYKETDCRQKNEEKSLSLERLDNGVVNETQPKPVKSIFDLDFEDNDDPLYSIMDETRKPVAKFEDIKNNLDTKNLPSSGSAQNVSLSLINCSADALIDNSNQEQENSEACIAVPSIFTVYEDPDCVANQRYYIQTNKVTSFHINVLHNFYIPNINGNWNSFDSPSTPQSEKDFLNTMATYTVTNGADVVPKYGLFTSDQIRKDLSSLKFIKPFKAKILKSFMSPFLGVAKCLPTCRRVKHTAKEKPNSSTTVDLISKGVEGPINNIEYKFNSCSPLNVNTDVPISGMDSHNENHVPMQVNSIIKNSCSVNSFSYNLLKLANDEVQFGDTEMSNSGSSSSNCSFFSLKQSQDLTNDNLQNKRAQSLCKKSETTQGSKRKYAGDASEKKKHNRYAFNVSAKRTKTVFNSNLFNDSSNNNSSDSANEAGNDNENDYENINNDEYAIIQRPVGDGSSSSNHIVLTIKKTPSKINSPANSMTAVSPNNSIDAANVKKSTPKSCLEDTVKPQSTAEIAFDKKNVISKTRRLASRPRHTRYRRTCRRNYKSERQTIDLELKHLFHMKPKATDYCSNIKLHNKLFFHHELCMETAEGIKERIMNYSSSSSSSYDEDSEVENNSFGELLKEKNFAGFNTYNSKIENENSVAVAISQDKFNAEEDSFLASLDESDNDGQEELRETSDTVDDLNDFENNKMLQSFNLIFAESTLTNADAASVIGMKSSPPKTSIESLKKENFDTSYRVCNNNHLDVDLTNEFSNISRKSIKSSESLNKLPLLRPEYRTGILSSCEAAPNSKADKNLTRIQQFREWHQVLQLKSYNNEPLIVLPYVLLE